MNVRIEESWKRELAGEFQRDYFKALAHFVKEEYARGTVYPPPKEIFRAYDMCSFDKVKVVILGQDPYHGPEQANGLCFSVRESVAIPPSLKNIYKEIEEDTGQKMPRHGSLERWARQGVLLLNATLTVRAGSPASHQGKGWESFTDATVKLLNDKKDALAFLLWGSYAQKKGAVLDRNKHFVLEAAHPSPFSAERGFFGCHHFSLTNYYLIMAGKEPVKW